MRKPARKAPNFALRSTPSTGPAAPDSAASRRGTRNANSKNRTRWLRNRLTRAGTRRALHLGWPNTLHVHQEPGGIVDPRRGAGLPIAIVRPSIVETSTAEPFPAGNEGINTSAPLSYLLGTYFRQLPTTRASAWTSFPWTGVPRDDADRRGTGASPHAPLYQLATSAANPCDMGRTIELTGLAHRKHYRAQQGLEHWMRLRFETIRSRRTATRNFRAAQKPW